MLRTCSGSAALRTSRLPIAVLLWAAASVTACGDDSTPDAGVPTDATTHPDATVEADSGVHPDAGPPGTLQLVRAFTADGQRVVVELSAEPATASLTTDAFAIEISDGAPLAVAIRTVTSSATEVVLETDVVLPKDRTYLVRGVSVTDRDGSGVDAAHATTPVLGKLHLAIIWHQHQPLYVEPNGDYLRGPWVRKHAVKDYYDMAAMLGAYPDVHVMVNLTPVLLYQLERYYLDRLRPFVNLAEGTVDTAGYFAQLGAENDTPITDPWVDLLLRPTPTPGELSDAERGWLWADDWNTFSIADALISRFPAYAALRTKKNTNPASLTQADLLAAKLWFQLAWFDPDFLRGPVTLPDGSIVDLSDVVTEDANGRFTLDVPPSEALCQRLVVEEYKVMANVVAAHKQLMWDVEAKTGQIEVMTTPFFHPILPLLVDSDLAKIAMPSTALPSQRFQQPQDARDHVAKARDLFEAQFEKPMTGMWPAEGSVAEAVVPLFQEAGVRWIATDRRVLERSTPMDQPIYSPYRVDVDDVVGDGGGTDDELAIVFRDTELSDKLGFFYQGSPPSVNVADFMGSLEKHLPTYGTDHLLTVILDGENAWEHYLLDHDAKGFLNGMYAAITEAQDAGALRTVTITEYLDGNPARGVEPHPVRTLPELEPLWAGSWISGNYSTWIGEDEENLAWDYLATVRADLARFEGQGLARPVVGAAPPAPGTPAFWAAQAWQAMYAAEGSDWFWWYGSDQTAAGGDDPFDRIFIETLKDVYRNARRAGIDTLVPDLAPILRTCVPPRGPLTGTVTIDGVFVPDDGRDPKAPNEWTNAGSGVCTDVDSGVNANPDDVLGTYYHGLSSSALHVAVRMNDDLAARLGGDYQVRLYVTQKHIVSTDPPVVEQGPKLAETRLGQPLAFLAGGAAREVVVDFSGASVTASVATTDGATWGAPVAAPTIEVAAGTDVLELTVPFDVIDFEDGDPLELVAIATSNGQELDRLPNVGSVVLAVDRTQLVEVTFVLDATGSRLALDAVKPITNPPPPRGTGRAFIVGSLEPLGNWTPNSIPMADDGATHGDAVAGDNLWTFRMVVPPLTEVNYKYTIGSAGDGWGPTEEYPLTNRGFEVRDLDGDLKMVLRDVFADRPDPSGSLPARTEVTNP
ncbi:hypothetical protein L6R52_14760 [Myxococcota bacterium]|nr:hypothetical protein [Myxococcota bacterium]